MTNVYGNIFTELKDELTVNIVKAVKRAIAERGVIAKRIPETSTRAALVEMVSKCHDVLFDTKTVFPFDPFPDTVTLDREKVAITYRSFFFVAKVISIPIRDLLNVQANVGPFFGTLNMSSRYFATTPCTINFLKRDDALRLQRLLQGYIICEEQNIETSNIDKDQLVVMLNDLGSDGAKVIRR